MSQRLSVSMTLTQFNNGYWYAEQLKEFATAIGIPAAGRMRKNELEAAIKVFLKTGRLGASTPANLPQRGVKDVERGLRLGLPVAVYTNDQTTKNFLESEARKLVSGYKRKSGARYRLNRWREAQLARGTKITYRDLVKEYVRLSQVEAFAQIPHGRYINFMSDFLASKPGTTWKQALRAWKKIKRLDVPKNYVSWVKFHKAPKRRGKR